jgi:hypothetical protein
LHKKQLDILKAAISDERRESAGYELLFLF